MTNEELKKKIKEILRKRMTELLGSCHTDKIPLTEEGAEAILFYADEFADALIAAGIGDISPWKHRAEVAENELKLYKLAVKIWQERYSDIRCFNFNIALKQAEKDLTEEKDGKKEV